MYFLHVFSDDSFLLSGIDRPKGCKVVKTCGSTLVGKVPPSSHWTGIGLPRTYDPAEFEVYCLDRPYDGPGGYRASKLVSFPARQPKGE